MPASASAPPAPTWGRADLVHLALLAVVTATWAHHLTDLARRADSPPQADAASHAVRAVAMHGWLHHDPLSAVSASLYLQGGYPPFVYALTALLFGEAPSGGALLRGIHLLAAVGLLGGWLLARASLGRASAWVWVLLFAGSPVAVGYAGHFLLDLPLASTVGVGLWMLLLAGRFQRPGTGLGFGVVTGWSVLTKWTAFYFLGPAAAFVALSGLAGALRRRRIAANGLLALAITLLAILFAFAWGASRPQVVQPEGISGGITLVVAAAWALGAGLLFLWARRAEAAAASRGGFAALAGLGLVAGPYYTLAFGEMLDLAALHGAHHPSAGLVADTQRNAAHLAGLFPGLLLLLAAAGVRLVWTRSREGGVALLALGAGFVLTVTTAPMGDRYLLPLLPVAATVVAAAVSTLPAVARWALVGGIAAIGGFALSPRKEADLPAYLQRRELPDVTVTLPVAGWTVEVLRDPTDLDFDGFHAAMAAIDEVCAGACDVGVWGREDAWVQPRTFRAAAHVEGRVGLRWTSTSLDAPLRPIAAEGPTLLVIQPCGLRPAAPLSALEQQAAQALGTDVVPVGRFPLPGGCEMSVSRVGGGEAAAASAPAVQ